jgi:hypothetical protein
MSRQYFADTLTEPINSDYTNFVGTSETVLIPTAFTPINAMEPRGGKVYELLVGGICTTGASGTLTITPRFGTTIAGTIIGNTSSAQTVVPSITNAPFLLRYYLIIRSIGLTGAASNVIGYGYWQSMGAIATASSETDLTFGTTGAATAVDTSIAQALWMGMTFSVAPSVTPKFHVWRSLN